LSINGDRRQHADPPWKLAVPCSVLVLVQHALKDELQVSGIDCERLIVPIADEFAVADVVGVQSKY